MVKQFIFSLFLFFSCAHSPYLKTKDGISVKQCNLPIHYAISDNIPYDYRKLVESGFQYWNDVTGLGDDLLLRIGVISYYPDDPETDSFVLVAWAPYLDKEDRKVCAITEYDYSKYGCMKATKVLISTRCLNYGKKVMESIMRHEIGHVLGLRHSSTECEIMYIGVASKKKCQHPIDASDREINAVKKHYGFEK